MRRTPDRFTDMRSFRYVLADVFTDRPLAGNQLAVFTDARDLDEVTMQELALELGLQRERLRAAAARGRHGADPDLHAEQRDRRSPAIRASAPRSCSARRSSSGVIALETGAGIVPVELERDESGRIVYGQDDATGPDGRSVRPRGRAARGARCRPRPSCRSRCTTTASGTRSSRSRRGRRLPR